MDDGRHFTDYRPSCHVNNLVRANNGINNSFEFRMFLTQNANKLMNLNRSYSCQKNCSGSCSKPYHVGTMLPESSIVTCDKIGCSTIQKNPKGLGQGRNYGYNDDCVGWSKLPIGQPYNCCSDTKNLFNYYDDIKEKIPRTSIQGGGKAMSGGDPQSYPSV